MLPDQPDSQSGISKRHRKPRSYSMTEQRTVMDLNSEAGSSRKHDLHEKDAQVEGPSKRPKVNRGSEPPMCKDTTMAPKAKHNKSREKVNHHKAPRTRNHQQLKDRVKTLECEKEGFRQARDDKIKELQAKLDGHITELKTERDENQHLNRKLQDATNGAEALQLSCKDKEEELKGKEETIATQQRELEHSKHQCASLNESLGQARLTVKDKDEIITALRKELDDEKRQSASLERSVAKKELELKAQDEVIATNQKELDDSRHQSSTLNESLSKANLMIKDKDEIITLLRKDLDNNKRKCSSLEISVAKRELELKAKDGIIITNQKELDDIKRQYASLEESLAETKHELKTAKRVQSDWRNKLTSIEQELDSTKQELDDVKKDRDEATKDVDALRLINDKNGFWNHKITQREENAKEKLKSERTENQKSVKKLDQEQFELQGRCEKLQADLEAQEDERNHAVGSLQSKLNASRQRYNYKEPDEKVKTDFTNLESKIRQFVDKYARPVLKATDKELETVWPNWSPKLRRFLASPLLCTLALEAYVWEYLVSRIFTPGSKIWAGELGESLEETLRLAAEKIAEKEYKSDHYIDFQYLRSSSGSLISRLSGSDFPSQDFESDMENMTSTLAKLCGLNEIDAAMKTDAMDIFEDARDFEIQLRLLKPVFTFRMDKFLPGEERVKFGFFFADAEMDDRSPNRSGKSPGQAAEVDFIMCPGLYKRGNNGGAKYEAETCLIKMGVVCNTTELTQKSGSSISAKSIPPRAPKALRHNEIKQEDKGSTSRQHRSSTPTKKERGSSFTDPLHVDGEEPDSEQGLDPLPTPGRTSSSPARKARKTAQMQSGPGTRSQGPPKTDQNVRDGNSSTKSANNHHYPKGSARGRGGGSSAKKPRQSKRTDPDAAYNPSSNI